MIHFGKLFHSFGFAIQDIKQAFVSQQNIKIHSFVAFVVVIAGFVFDISNMEWIAIVGCIALVFAAEIFNTAIENIVDYISLERHPIAGKIKDLAAAAVFVCAMMSVIVGCLIFLPKIF